MDLWENFWSKDRNQSLLFSFGQYLPAGPWDFRWRWKRYEKFLKKINIKNPRIIELGCGTGIMTFRMLERLGGEAVLLDSSESALKTAKEFSKEFDIDKDQVKYVAKDIFEYDDAEKFDIVHSQGLIEHFQDQSKIIGEHFRLTKRNGYVLILAPRPSIFYKAARKTYELYKGKWMFGYENPLETNKVVGMVRKNNADIVKRRDFIFSMGCLSKKL
jgi:ubiquinone/menaquinone biosynthesis C-methylase UbiE